MAWWFPETTASSLLGWVASALLVYAVRARRAYLPAYCCGLACCSLGFYWIVNTVTAFGGFGIFAAALVFGLFVTLSAVQFLLFAFFHHNLGAAFDALALRSPTALVLSELIAIRVFPWHFGHTQIVFTSFVQVADLGGALLVSFLMIWLAEAGVRAIVFRERRWGFLLPVIGFGLALGYGTVMERVYSSPRGETQTVVLVQGNIPLRQESGPDSFDRNVGRFHELSRQASRANALIVWPEGAIPAFLPADSGSASNVPVLPWINDGSAFLVGSYAIDRDGARYNAAFAVEPDGRVPRPYYKRILIPFGEYMPFASVFPWIKNLNAHAGVFRAGTNVKVFPLPMRRKDGSTYALKVSPLICYEDTVPALSREATLAGAELLVNLTYDTWFGRSVAPHEHHLIAAFRAIENRRFLVRATNTGLSAVVDPLGRTIARLPTFSEATLEANVVLMKNQSLYTRYVRERPWWALLVTSLAVIVERRRRGTRV
jgi:apolipoprotein N-acyltransferase